MKRYFILKHDKCGSFQIINSTFKRNQKDIIFCPNCNMGERSKETITTNGESLIDKFLTAYKNLSDFLKDNGFSFIEINETILTDFVEKFGPKE